VAQRKISFLIASVLLLILISMVGFGSAVVYSLSRWQSAIPDTYARPLAAYKAISDTHSDLARLNSRTMEFVLASNPAKSGQLQRTMQELDENLREDVSLIKAEFSDTVHGISMIERALDDWQAERKQIAELVRRGHRDQALQLVTGPAAQTYSQLETSLNTALASARQRAENLAESAQSKSSRLIHLAWWLLAGLAASNILFGMLVIRRVGVTLVHDMQTTKMLYESEQRLKLALSGADEGTWDLDIPSGKINFDSLWGDILGYSSEQERPHYFDDWVALIHTEDRDRVLKAMSDHVEGWTAEYKVEYRIRSRSGEMRWVLGHGRAVRRDQAGKALRMVGVTRDITLKKEVEDKIWNLAHSDFLTGLPNRPLFYDRLRQAIAQAKRHDQKLALLFLDLDGFKLINDRFGHDTGDALLQEVAQRLRHNIRGEDTVARTGGDEFIVILNNITHAGDAAIVAGKIIQALTERFIIHDHTCTIGGSIGISIFPDDSDDMEALVSHADDAMYKAKEMGKNNYQFFSSGL